jgi:hypothetical protein
VTNGTSYMTRSTNQDKIAKLLQFHTGLEWQLKLATLEDDVGEVEQVNLKRI